MSIKTKKTDLRKLVREVYKRKLLEMSNDGEMMQVAAQIADKLRTEVDLQAQNRQWDADQLYQIVVTQFKNLKSLQAKREE